MGFYAISMKKLNRCFPIVFFLHFLIVTGCKPGHSTIHVAKILDDIFVENSSVYFKDDTLIVVENMKKQSEGMKIAEYSYKEYYFVNDSFRLSKFESYANDSSIKNERLSLFNLIIADLSNASDSFVVEGNSRTGINGAFQRAHHYERGGFEVISFFVEDSPFWRVEVHERATGLKLNLTIYSSFRQPRIITFKKSEGLIYLIVANDLYLSGRKLVKFDLYKVSIGD